MLIRLWELYQRGKWDVYFIKFEKQAQFLVYTIGVILATQDLILDKASLLRYL